MRLGVGGLFLVLASPPNRKRSIQECWQSPRVSSTNGHSPLSIKPGTESKRQGQILFRAFGSGTPPPSDVRFSPGSVTPPPLRVGGSEGGSEAERVRGRERGEG